MRRVRVEVTADDIAAGKTYDCFHCPVAIALARATGFEQAYAGPGSFGNGNGRKGATPTEASEFMYAFDAGKQVQPFAFEVEFADA